MHVWLAQHRGAFSMPRPLIRLKRTSRLTSLFQDRHRHGRSAAPWFGRITTIFRTMWWLWLAGFGRRLWTQTTNSALSSRWREPLITWQPAFVHEGARHRHTVRRHRPDPFGITSRSPCRILDGGQFLCDVARVAAVHIYFLRLDEGRRESGHQSPSNSVLSAIDICPGDCQ
jgi:hypothetical protein